MIRSLPGMEGIILTEKKKSQARGFFDYVAAP
jgi:hypothetical protein